MIKVVLINIELNEIKTFCGNTLFQVSIESSENICVNLKVKYVEIFKLEFN